LATIPSSPLSHQGCLLLIVAAVPRLSHGRYMQSF
jgi:hypothetical protein